MIKTPLKKSHRSPKTLIAFATMMFISFFFVTCLVFPKFEAPSIKLAILISFGLAALFGVVSWLLDPGYLYKDSDLDFMTLLE